ncbi:DUF433 domain-containing protein [Aequorivita sp. H23M31]|uniref:DUF433 domain-containing protein n=1 Tax=Aequorivita ciconiae TaxID=2494375 RepID=A0A410G4G4_9FLAO|nr:DUF433 domain-containing protein [Aequorivita sp. H23M31]QAA82177.1 DUF433 domain-containing protein [Aequorivita sp. H23M31]
MEKGNDISKFISSDPGILGGTPVFLGTRVPVSILFDYLKGGDTLQDFLDNYPTIKKSVAKKVIELSAETLLN